MIESNSFEQGEVEVRAVTLRQKMELHEANSDTIRSNTFSATVIKN